MVTVKWFAVEIQQKKCSEVLKEISPDYYNRVGKVDFPHPVLNPKNACSRSSGGVERTDFVIFFYWIQKSDVEFSKSDVDLSILVYFRHQTSNWSFSELRKNWAYRFYPVQDIFGILGTHTQSSWMMFSDNVHQKCIYPKNSISCMLDYIIENLRVRSDDWVTYWLVSIDVFSQWRDLGKRSKSKIHIKL